MHKCLGIVSVFALAFYAVGAGAQVLDQTNSQNCDGTPSETITIPCVASKPIWLPIGSSKQFTVTRSYTKIQIANPEIVDVLAQTDRSAILVPKKAGRSDILVIDDQSKVIMALKVTVDNFNPDEFIRVAVHNKALLNSSTNFMCSSTGCEYVDETTMQEPAPLPRGHLETTNTNVNSNVYKTQ